MKQKNRIGSNRKGCIAVINRPGELVFFENLIEREVVAVAKTVAHAIPFCPMCKSSDVHDDMSDNIILTNGSGKVKCLKCGHSGLKSKWIKKFVELFDIYTFEEHRGKGYAKELLEYIMEACDILVTSWNESTPEGREFCQACGMVKNGEWLQWDKP